MYRKLKLKGNDLLKFLLQCFAEFPFDAVHEIRIKVYQIYAL